MKKEIIVFCLVILAILSKYAGYLHPREALIAMLAVTILYCALALREIWRGEEGAK